MNCCANCFSDEQIKKIIVDNGHIGDCDFCGEKQVPVCSVDEATDISDLISDVLSVYEENERGRPLFSAIIEDWNIFRKDLPSSAKLIEAFCSTIYDDSSANYNVSVEIPRAQLEEYGIFSGHTWGEFSNAIKRKNRFHNNYFKADRFSPFLGYSIRKYPKGTKLYRARICNDIKGFEKSEMGAPPAHLRKAGRVNPEGIGVLYLTSDEQTALSEVRAGTFDYVTIGTFQLKKEIRVVNISELNKISPVLYSSNIESLSANTKIFRDIANEIAKVFGEKIVEIYNISNVYLLDRAEANAVPSNINHMKDVVIFAFIGLVIAAVYVLIANMLDNTIKTEQDVEATTELLVLSSIPNYDVEIKSKRVR